jgi:hypothetical protein
MDPPVGGGTPCVSWTNSGGRSPVAGAFAGGAAVAGGGIAGGVAGAAAFVCERAGVTNFKLRNKANQSPTEAATI